MQSGLRTERMRLRRLTEADGDNLYRLDSDARVMRYINGGAPHSRAHVVEVQLPEFLRCNRETEAPGFVAAIERGTGRFLGWFHLRPTGDGVQELELGYRLIREAWGQGLATEGALALVNHAFETLDTQRIIAIALQANNASIRVMQKLGMQFEKTLTEPNTNEPAVVYGVDRAAWQRWDAQAAAPLR